MLLSRGQYLPAKLNPRGRSCNLWFLSSRPDRPFARNRTWLYPSDHDRRGLLDRPQILLYCFHKIDRIARVLFLVMRAIIGREVIVQWGTRLLTSSNFSLYVFNNFVLCLLVNLARTRTILSSSVFCTASCILSASFPHWGIWDLTWSKPPCGLQTMISKFHDISI